MLLFKLGSKVAEHSAGNLIKERLDVDAKVLRIQQAGLKSFVSERSEVICNLSQKLLIKSGVIRSTFEGFDHNFGGRLGSTQCEGRHCGINDIHACFYGFQ